MSDNNLSVQRQQYQYSNQYQYQYSNRYSNQYPEEARTPSTTGVLPSPATALFNQQYSPYSPKSFSSFKTSPRGQPGIVYSNTEFNHHDFLNNKHKTINLEPLDNDNESDWTDCSENWEDELIAPLRGPINQKLSQYGLEMPQYSNVTIEQRIVQSHDSLLQLQSQSLMNSRMNSPLDFKEMVPTPISEHTVMKKSSLKDLFKKKESSAQENAGSENSKEIEKENTKSKESSRFSFKNKLLKHKTEPVKSFALINTFDTGNKDRRLQQQQQQQQQQRELHSSPSITPTEKSFPVVAKESTEPKYHLKSTPIINNYQQERFNSCELSNRPRPESSVISRRKPSALIIRVPQSMCASDSLVSSGTEKSPFEFKAIVPPATSAIPEVSEEESAAGEEQQLKSPQFYFVSTPQFENGLGNEEMGTKKNSPSLTLSSSDNDKQSLSVTTSTTTTSHSGTFEGPDMDLVSPTSSQDSDIDAIKNQYQSEPSSRNSLKNSAKAQQGGAFAFKGSVKIEQQPFTTYDNRRISNSQFRLSTSSCIVPLNDLSEWQSEESSDHTYPQVVKVKDESTAIVKGLRPRQTLDPAKNSYTAPETHNASSSSNNNNSNSKCSFDRYNRMSARVNRASRVPRFDDIAEEIEETLATGDKTMLLDDDELNDIEKSLSRDYRMKKQQERMMKLQEFHVANGLKEAVPRGNKRMTLSLLYSDFSQSEADLQSKEPKVCFPATKLRHFSPSVSPQSKNSEQRFQKALSTVPAPSSKQSDYDRFFSAEKIIARKSFMNYVACHQ